MSSSKKLISNTIYLFLNWFFVTLFSFLYWIIVGKNLLPQEYGIITTSLNIVMILTGISLIGLDMAISKLIPEFLEMKQQNKVKSLIKFSLKIVLIINIIFALSLFLTSSYISSIFKLPEKTIFIIAIALFFYSFCAISGPILHGFQNMRKFFQTNFIGNFLQLIISFILVLLGFSYFGPLIAFVLCFFTISVLRLDLSWFKQSHDKIDNRHVVFGYSLPAFTSYLASMTTSNLQFLILPIIKNSEATGIYAVAMMVISIISVLPGILTQALFPITSQLCVGHNKREKQAYLINLALRYALFIVLPISIFLAFFSKPIILLFSRSEYLSATALFPILAIGAIIDGSGNIFLSSLYAIRKPKINRNITIVTAIVFLLTSISLIYYYSVFGLSFAYLFSVLITFLLSYFYLKKYLLFKLPSKTIFKLLISSIPFLLICYITDILQIILIFKLIIVGLGVLIYLFVLLLLKFYIKEDIKIIEFVIEKVPILKKPLLVLSKFISKFVNT